MKEIKCSGFIFDVDATLVDTMSVIDDIWKAWASLKGISFTEVFPYVHGRKVNETLSMVDEKYNNIQEQELIKSIAIEKMESAKPVKGALGFISKIPLDKWSVATSGPRSIATTSMKASGFPLPNVMICGEDVDKGKPHPAPFLKAATQLGITSDLCVAFEDSPVGVKSAKAAGCFTIALLTSHDEEELLEVNADLIIQDFSKLHLCEDSSGFLIKIEE
ncbi:HAD-IA family hydrolase [Vibrio splendidus]